MTKIALECNGGIYRIDSNDGLEIYDSVEELLQKYNIVGRMTNAICPQVVVVEK